MLVLTRKEGEVICIGEHIRIKVVEIDRNRVKLGIEAPEDVPIHRLEILLRNQTPPPAPPAPPLA